MLCLFKVIPFNYIEAIILGTTPTETDTVNSIKLAGQCWPDPEKLWKKRQKSWPDVKDGDMTDLSEFR